MAKVLIPTPLRQFAEKKDSVEVAGSTVGEALAALTTARQLGHRAEVESGAEGGTVAAEHCHAHAARRLQPLPRLGEAEEHVVVERIALVDTDHAHVGDTVDDGDGDAVELFDEAEERALAQSALVITSTRQEAEQQYARYAGFVAEQAVTVSPGVNASPATRPL